MNINRKRQLEDRTVVVIGGTRGIGLETPRLARNEGADVIITARDPERLRSVGLELEASIAAFDVTDLDRLGKFFDELPPIDHVLVTGPGPYDAPLSVVKALLAVQQVVADPVADLLDEEVVLCGVRADAPALGRAVADEVGHGEYKMLDSAHMPKDRWPRGKTRR